MARPITRRHARFALDEKFAFKPEESSKLELKDLSLIEELKAYLQYIKVEDTDSVITEFQELNVQ